MATVTKIQKARKSPGSCETCHKVIEAGEPYFKWAFRFGGAHKNCAEHYPRPSQLTQSKMSEAHSAIEDAESNVSSWGDPVEGDPWTFPSVDEMKEQKVDDPTVEPNLPDVEDLRGYLNDAIETLNDVAQEYRDASEAMPASAEQNDERADLCESAVSELEQADFEEFESWIESNPVGEGETMSEKIEEWIEEQKTIASDALSAVDLG